MSMCFSTKASFVVAMMMKFYIELHFVDIGIAKILQNEWKFVAIPFLLTQSLKTVYCVSSSMFMHKKGLCSMHLWLLIVVLYDIMKSWLHGINIRIHPPTRVKLQGNGVQLVINLE